MKVFDYVYQPVNYPDSIRVLAILPGAPKDNIRVTLQEIQLVDDVRFEALSYTWATEEGDDTRSRTIECEGRFIWITVTCEAALRRFRKKDVERVLWVDAICINQGSLEERSHQVGLMRDIYTKASHVLVWVGEASKDVEKGTSRPVSDVFLEYLDHMVAEFGTAGGKPTPLYQSFVSTLYAEYNTRSYPSAISRGFKNIVKRRWWQRIWVVQEVALAKSTVLWCGKMWIDYMAFHRLYYKAFFDQEAAARFTWIQFSESKGHFLSALAGRKKPAGPDGSHTRLLSTLIHAGTLQATQAVDYIFGIRGLPELTYCAELLPEPDYTKTTQQIFTEVFKRWQKNSPTTEMLYVAPRSHEHLPNLPSWVPDWSNPSSMSHVPTGDFKMNNACASTPAFYEISSDDKTLRIKGRIIDTLSEVTPLSAPSISTRPKQELGIASQKASCALWSSWSSRLYPHPCSHQTEEAFHTLWRTITWNRTPGRPFPTREGDFEAFKQWYDILMFPPEKSAETIMREWADVKRVSLQLVPAGPPLGVTEKERLISVPRAAEVGDVVVVLTGGGLPVVLREVSGDEAGRRRYRLVGQCYMQEISEGEAWNEESGELKWIDII